MHSSPPLKTESSPFDSPQSQVSSSFRTPERGTLLRNIAYKSQALSQLQNSLLLPLQEMAEKLSKQKNIIHEALKHNETEHHEVLHEQTTIKSKFAADIKAVKETNTVLSQHKKVLVSSVHTARSTSTETKAGMDLYRFALQGVEADLSNEASSDRLSRTESQSVGRAKQLALMRLSRKRDELNRVTREIEETKKKFQKIESIVLLLEKRAAVLQAERVQQKIEACDGGGGGGGGGGESSEDSAGGSKHSRNRSRSSTPKSESWARRRISRVTQRFSPEKKSAASNGGRRPGEGEEKGGPTDQELTHQICECLAEAMLLDEKLDQLVGSASQELDVMGPIDQAEKIMRRERGGGGEGGEEEGRRRGGGGGGDTSSSREATNPEMEVVKGMLLECCSLLLLSANQKKRNINSSFVAMDGRRTSTKEYANEMATRTLRAWSALHPTASVPPGLSIFLQTANGQSGTLTNSSW